jgi:hypothetical protein
VVQWREKTCLLNAKEAMQHPVIASSVAEDGRYDKQQRVLIGGHRDKERQHRSGRASHIKSMQRGGRAVDSQLLSLPVLLVRLAPNSNVLSGTDTSRGDQGKAASRRVTAS